MTVKEFSDEFDSLLNSYSIKGDFGEATSKSILTLDEYEKSVYLTKAQEEIILEIYSGKNPLGDSFERTEEIRRYLSELIKTYSTSEKIEKEGVSDTSVFFRLPNDLWFITYETVTLSDSTLGCLDGETIIVVPVTQDEFYRISRNPFRRPSNNKALRLDISDNVVEISSTYNISKYTVRYLAKPKPIILVDLNDLYIDNLNTKTECELNSNIHRSILDRAVKLVLQSRTTVSNK